jgi:hypothetical protein
MRLINSLILTMLDEVPKSAVDWAPLFHILQVPASNPSPETEYLTGFRSLFSVGVSKYQGTDPDWASGASSTPFSIR